MIGTSFSHWFIYRQTIPAAEAKRAKVEPLTPSQDSTNEEPPASPSSEIDPDGAGEDADIINDDDSPITNSKSLRLLLLRCFFILLNCFRVYSIQCLRINCKA